MPHSIVDGVSEYHCGGNILEKFLFVNREKLFDQRWSKDMVAAVRENSPIMLVTRLLPLLPRHPATAKERELEARPPDRSRSIPS